MAISVNEYVPKLEKLLEKFSETNFEIENDVYLNTLLSHLAGKDNKGRVLVYFQSDLDLCKITIIVFFARTW